MSELPIEELFDIHEKNIEISGQKLWDVNRLFA